MNKNYTKEVSTELAQRLKELGFPAIETIIPDYFGEVGDHIKIYPPTYANVFDWLIEKGIYIDIYACYMYVEFGVEHWVFGGDVASKGTNCSTEEFRTWEEAAVSAIDMALIILEEER